MLPRGRRLPYAEFQARGYTTQKTPFFSLKIKTNGARGPRIGVIVGKNVHKAAAKRNFFKRQARDVLAPLVQGNRDVMLIVQPRVNELSKRALGEALKKAIREAL
jgi:ribonuclease P protein component